MVGSILNDAAFVANVVITAGSIVSTNYLAYFELDYKNLPIFPSKSNIEATSFPPILATKARIKHL